MNAVAHLENRRIVRTRRGTKREEPVKMSASQENKEEEAQESLNNG